jgi:iron complex outermembrane receptor protein
MTASSLLTAAVLLACLGTASSLPSSLQGLEDQEPSGRLRVLVESREGEPIPGALVRAGAVRGLTDDAGVAILVLAAGGVEVHVERLGFARASATAVVPAGGEAEVRIVMELEVLQAEGIVVTSTRGDRRLEDEPLRVEIIGREEVEEKLLMTPGDIAMLLNETAGLRVQPASGSLGGASVRIQGMRGRYALILADGLPLYGGQSGALGPLQIPPMDLGQVEVIKGVASALYGSTALAGVVNLVSRRPEPSREILLNVTTQSGTDAVLWLAGEAAEGWGYTFLGGLHGQRRADVGGDGWADVPGYRRAVARPRLFWNDGRGRSVLVTVGGMAEDREGGTLPGKLTPGGDSYTEVLMSRRGDAGVVARSLTAGGRLLALRGSASFQKHQHRFGEVREEDQYHTAFLEGSVSGVNGRHAWVVGTAIQQDVFHSRDVPGFDYTHTVPSFFLQDEVEVAPVLVLSASARLDAHSAYGTFVSPRVSALFRPGPWAMRASAGTGYFAPTPLTEEVEAVGLARLAPLPPDLAPERGWSASLDVGRELGELEVNASAFASTIREPVRVEPGAGGLLILSNAPGPVRSWGGELFARYHGEPLHLLATYAYTRSREAELDGLEGGGVAVSEAGAPARREVPLTPRHTVGLVAALEDDERGRVGMEIYYTGRQALEDHSYRAFSRGYLILGVLVERRMGRVRWFLNAENILDARQTRWTPLLRPSPSPEGRWTTDIWTPLEGRVINGGVRISIH